MGYPSILLYVVIFLVFKSIRYINPNMTTIVADGFYTIGSLIIGGGHVVDYVYNFRFYRCCWLNFKNMGLLLPNSSGRVLFYSYIQYIRIFISILHARSYVQYRNLRRSSDGRIHHGNDSLGSTVSTSIPNHMGTYAILAWISIKEIISISFVRDICCWSWICGNSSACYVHECIESSAGVYCDSTSRYSLFLIGV